MKHKIIISCLGWVHNSRSSYKMSQSSWLDLKRLELVLFAYFVSKKTKQTRKEDTRGYFSLYFVLVISHPLGPTGTLAALREARGRRMDEGKGGRNGLAARDFRGREGHWVAGRGWQGREALGRVVEAGGRGRCPGGQSAWFRKRGGSKVQQSGEGQLNGGERGAEVCRTWREERMIQKMVENGGAGTR